MKEISPKKTSLTGITMLKINSLIRTSSIMRRMKILLLMSIFSISSVSFKSGSKTVQSACQSKNLSKKAKTYQLQAWLNNNLIT